MKSIIFICPYFGKLPKEQFLLWLKTCSYNETINWLIITDDVIAFDLPENVNVINLSLNDLKNKIQSKFDFEIKLENPYKLCDYKPMYGYLFPEWVKGYDFWGHCDMSDCLFGDLRKFLTEARLDNNEKIMFLGHMTLYKNKQSINERILLKTKSKIQLNQIIGVEENKAFDELNEYSINTIYQENNFPMCRIDNMYADISPMRYSFQLSLYDKEYRQYYEKKKNRIFEWEKGNLYDCIIENNHLRKEEIGYVHFQKRKMKNKIQNMNENHFIIVPEGFISQKNSLQYKNVKKYAKEKWIYIPFFKLKFKALMYKLRRKLCK